MAKGRAKQPTKTEPRLLTLAILLAALAGYVDAIGFLYLHGLYVAFMSGNSTRLAASLGHGDWRAAASIAVVIGCFLAGVVAGQLVTARHIAMDLACVALLLSGAGVAYRTQQDVWIAPLMALAMGVENCAIDRTGNVTLGLTYVTGTLVRLGRQIAVALRGEDRAGWLPHLLLWLGFSAGGLVGAMAFGRIDLDGLWIASGAAFALAAVSAWLNKLE